METVCKARQAIFHRGGHHRQRKKQEETLRSFRGSIDGYNSHTAVERGDCAM